MFGRKNSDNLKINTILGKNSTCHGDIFFEGSARIDGRVEGRLEATGTLIVGETAAIKGDIKAQAAVLGGSVEGNINAAEKTELTATAKVVGDITTALLVVDENALFQGRCSMKQEEADREEMNRAAEAEMPAEEEIKEETEEEIKEETKTKEEN